MADRETPQDAAAVQRDSTTITDCAHLARRPWRSWPVRHTEVPTRTRARRARSREALPAAHEAGTGSPCLRLRQGPPRPARPTRSRRKRTWPSRRSRWRVSARRCSRAPTSTAWRASCGRCRPVSCCAAPRPCSRPERPSRSTAAPSGSCTPSSKATISTRATTAACSRCGTRRTTWRRRRSAAALSAPSTSTDSGASTRYPRPSGTARRPSTASKRKPDRSWKTPTRRTDTQHPMRKEIWRRRQVWPWHKCPTGSKIVASEIARHNSMPPAGESKYWRITSQFNFGLFFCSFFFFAQFFFPLPHWLQCDVFGLSTGGRILKPTAVLVSREKEEIVPQWLNVGTPELALQECLTQNENMKSTKNSLKSSLSATWKVEQKQFQNVNKKFSSAKHAKWCGQFRNLAFLRCKEGKNGLLPWIPSGFLRVNWKLWLHQKSICLFKMRRLWP